MKPKKQTVFLIIGLLLLVVSGFLFSRRGNTVAPHSQAVALADWVYGSGGSLNVMVTYPEKLQTGRKNLIKVEYQADKALEDVLDDGVVFDLQLDMPNSVVQPQKRVLIPLENGRKSFTWEVEPFNAGLSEASISLALGNNSLSGNFAITAQQKIDFNMEIVKSTATRGELTTYGFIGLAAGLLSLMAAYLINRQPTKKRR